MISFMSTNETDGDRKLVPITNFGIDLGLYYKEKTDVKAQAQKLFKSSKIYDESFQLFELSDGIHGSRSELFVDSRNFWFISFSKDKPDNVSVYYTTTFDKNEVYIKFDNLFITDGMYCKPEGVSTFNVLELSQSVLENFSGASNVVGDNFDVDLTMNDSTNPDINQTSTSTKMRNIPIDKMINLLKDIKLSVHSEVNPGGEVTDFSIQKIKMSFRFSNEPALLSKFKNIKDKNGLNNFFNSEENKQWFQVMKVLYNQYSSQSNTFIFNTQPNSSFGVFSTNKFKEEEVSSEGDFPTNLYFRVNFQGLSSSNKSELKKVIEKQIKDEKKMESTISSMGNVMNNNKSITAKFKLYIGYTLTTLESVLANKSSSNDLMRARSEIMILTTIMEDVDQANSNLPLLHLFKEYSPIVASYYFSSKFKIHLMFAFNDLRLLNNIIEYENLTSFYDISKKKDSFDYLISIPHDNVKLSKEIYNISSQSSGKIDNLNKNDGFQLCLKSVEQSMLQKSMYVSFM